MRWDHWVLPPAVSAAVFAVLAIAPPVRAARRSVHRLESLGDPVAGRPWLLRALVATDSANPPRLWLTSPEAAVEELADVPPVGTWFRVQVPARVAAVRLEFGDAMGAHGRRIATTQGAPAPTSPPPESSPYVLEGSLVPELAGTVIVAASAGPVALVPVTEEVTVTPSHRELDACGLAAFEVRVAGLGAPVSIVSGDRRMETRLPLAAGGLAVRDEVDSILLRATVAGGTAHVVAGDALGPTWWSAVTLRDEADEGRARVTLPLGAAWVLAARSADLAEPVSPLVRPTAPTCLATPLGRRLARGRLAPPTLPPRRVLWDGPAEGAAGVGRQIQRARVLCCIGLAMSVVMEAMLLLGAGLSHGPTVLRPLAGDGRQRLGVLAAGISTLMLFGAALGLAVGLRTP